MNIFKNKSVVRLYAFITACLIILTLLLCGFNVCAEDNYSLAAQYNIDTTVLYNDDVESGLSLFAYDNENSNISSYESFVNSGINVSDYYYNGYGFKPSSNFNSWFTTKYSNRFGLGAVPDGSFFVMSDETYKIFYPENTVYPVNPDGSNTSVVYFSDDGEVVGAPTIIGASSDTVTFNNEDYSIYNFARSSNLNGVGALINTNCPIYSVDEATLQGISNGDNLDNILSNDNQINSSIGGGSDSSSETAENNMYFKNFNISYSVSGLKDGSIVCYGDLNEYQKEHLDEFALTYTFNFEYYVYNPVVTGYKYNFKKNYSYQQTLSDFYNNGSSKVFTLKDIMQNINTQDIDSEYGNLYQLVSYLSNTGNNENIEYIWSKAKMKTTVFIVSANDSPSDILNSSNLHSNSFSKAYNFLDGKSSTYSDGITNNNNPYESTETGSISDQNELNNMPNGVSSSNIPSSQADNGGSGTSVVTGDNNIVINNNPTFNNDGSVSGSGGGSSDGGVASTFYNTFNPFKTLFSSLNGDNSVISDDTAETIGSNRFISVMSSTFSFIPEGMWTALTTFLIASLSILIVAVVIRVLLDLL